MMIVLIIIIFATAQEDDNIYLVTGGYILSVSLITISRYSISAYYFESLSSLGLKYLNMDKASDTDIN